MSEKKRVGMFKRKDAGRYRRKPRAITSIPTRSLSKSGEGWENKVYKFKRSFLLSNNGDDWRYNSSTGYNPIDLTVMLDKLPNYTDFTSLFDSYRITGVEYRFVPHFNVGQVLLARKHASGSAGDRCGQGRQLEPHRPHCCDAVCIHGRVHA